MQTSVRPRDYTGGQRPKHIPQISISDDNHHVTEAISGMYEYGDQYGKRDSRPLSFLPSRGDEIRQPERMTSNDSSRSFPTRTPLNHNYSFDRSPPQTNGQSSPVGRSNSFGHEHGQLSPTLQSGGLRSPADTANSSFPLNDIDYESNPAAVAQELSNLQALRRMSMDVNVAGDPDLPSFNSGFGMPTIAPTGPADEDDASRLFWVPARLHPELAPKEFKTFLDNRVDSMKRRSKEFSLSPDGPSRQGSGGGLRRKKSMLSRQIDNSEGKGADGYQDGAERLDRKRSLSGVEALNTGISNLQELEMLVNDPEKVIQRLSVDTGQRATGGEVPASEDMPILPSAPGNSLRRSTRTTYRRGSLRKGERVLGSKRGPRTPEPDGDDITSASPQTPTPSSASEVLDIGRGGQGHELTRIRSEPTMASPPESTSTTPEPSSVEKPPPTDRSTANFSRPVRMNRNRVGSATGTSPTVSFENMLNTPPSQTPPEPQDRAATPPASAPVPRHFVSQIASNGRSTTIPGKTNIPQIIEPSSSFDGHQSLRSGSYESPSNRGSQRGGMRPSHGDKLIPAQTLRDMAAHPSPLPGNSTRTDSLSFIPTLTEDKKADVKKESTKKSSWSWGSLLGSEEREKEKRKEEEAKEANKRAKAKLAKTTDSTRLDLLQTTMDGGRGRESLVLDRGDKLDEERKKESLRKAPGMEPPKKEKDGIFSSLFGVGKKHKLDRESLGKKNTSRTLSPDPPHPVLKPDIDYNWTRFSILEERAIYRMAHIKLANPRRALHSQVLLSNFMYSYLAKVQQMHPQIQIPQNAAQKAQQRQQQLQQQQQQQQQQAQQRNADQSDEYYQYQKYQEYQQHEDEGQDQMSQSDGVPYIDDAQNYNYDHGDADERNRPASQSSQHGPPSMENGNGPYSQQGQYQYQQQQRGGQLQQSPYQYQHQQSQFDEPEREDDDEMW